MTLHRTSTPTIRSFCKSTIVALRPIWITGNELLVGIKTKQRSALGEVSKCNEVTKHGDGYSYETIDYWNIRKVLRSLRPRTTDVFYDIGAGMRSEERRVGKECRSR